MGLLTGWQLYFFTFGYNAYQSFCCGYRGISCFSDLGGEQGPSYNSYCCRCLNRIMGTGVGHFGYSTPGTTHPLFQHNSSGMFFGVLNLLNFHIGAGVEFYGAAFEEGEHRVRVG